MEVKNCYKIVLHIQFQPYRKERNSKTLLPIAHLNSIVLLLQPPKMENFAFYDIVQKLATSKGITVKQMESDLGLAKHHANKWKTSLPSFGSLLKVADYFGVSIDYLLDRESAYTEEETALIAKFRRLTASQRENILNNIDFLFSQNPVKKKR